MKVVTVARDGAKSARVGRLSFPVWVIAVYESKPRVRDGVVTWRRIQSIGQSKSGKHPSNKLISEAEAYAEAVDLRFESGIRHGQRIEMSELEQLAQVEEEKRNGLHRNLQRESRAKQLLAHREP